VDYYVVFSRGMRAPVDDTALYRPEPAAQPPTRQGRL
jgi:hypothetical protein